MITRISSCRKDYKCDKCGAAIVKGSSYIRGELNFGPTFIRCVSCGLRPWEVTTSEYLREAGRILDTWEDDFDYNAPEVAIDNIRADIESLLEETQERLDSMPEGLQEGSTGQLLQERIGGLENAIDDLDSIDIDQLKSEAVELIFSDPEVDDDDDYFPEYDAVAYEGSAKYDQHIKDLLIEELESNLRDAVNDALQDNIIYE